MRPNIIDLRGQLPTRGTFPTRPLGNIRILAVHYDGTDIQDDYSPIDTYKTEAQFHINKDWGGGAHGYGLEYHYCIARDGTIYQTEDEEALTWNATNANTLDLAIKVDSGPNTPPTPLQYIALKAMLDWLTSERPEMPAERGDVYGHGELVEYGNSTSCPGAAMLAWVQEYRVSDGTDAQASFTSLVEPTRESQAVTILSVIGDETYKTKPNMQQIQVLVQQGKALFGA